MENNNENVKVISLKDLFGIFLDRLWLILLVAIIVVSGTYTYNKLTYVPEYSSTATMYILKEVNENTASYDASNDFSLALKVVNDCDVLLKSHTVLDSVISQLSLELSYGELYGMISISNPEETRILYVTVKADTPGGAKEIVDSLCSIGAKKINSVMGYDQVNLYEFGTFNPSPCNQTGIMIYILLGVIAGAFVYLIYVIVFIADTSIRTDEDIQNYLGLSVIGDIPDADAGKGGGYKYKKYGRYGRYGRYSRYSRYSSRYGNRYGYGYGYGAGNTKTAENSGETKKTEEEK